MSKPPYQPYLNIEDMFKKHFDKVRYDMILRW